MKQFIIHKEDAIRRENCLQFINALDPKRKWRVTIKEYRKKRSNEQNAYIHAVPLKMMSDHTGSTLDEMKEAMCGEFAGWDTYDLLGKTHWRPLITTSQMDTLKMTEFIEYMQWFASTNMNLYIPSPNEWEGEY